MHCVETGLRGRTGQDLSKGLWVGKQWMPFVGGCIGIIVGLLEFRFVELE